MEPGRRLSAAEDPYETLGVPVGATDDDIARAYRDLAKRHHPDLAGDDGSRMRDINAAYEQIQRSDGAILIADRSSANEFRPEGAGPPRAEPGAWLSPSIRRQLGRELLEALTSGEAVLMVFDASTWDSPSVRMVLTGNRLLWLRDDAPVGRVRSIRYGMISSVEGPVNRRGRGELRVRPVDARRLSFAEVDGHVLERAVMTIRSLMPASRRAHG